MADIAMLVHTQGDGAHAKNRKHQDFDHMDNIGAFLIIDVLKRAGHEVDFCDATTAHLYKVVLISLTSPHDTYSLIKNAGRLATWQRDRRPFVAIAGGAGCQNVAPLRHYVDYAVFGRAETFVVELVEAALARRDYHHESVMALREEVRPVRVQQATEVYPYEIDIGYATWREVDIGCPHRCAFCHYSYARKWNRPQAADYVHQIRTSTTESIIPIMIKELKEADDDHPLLRQSVLTGIDGLSQRLRYAINKRISNDQIVEVIEEISRRTSMSKVFFKMFMIGSYPTESDADFAEFLETMARVQPPGAPARAMIHLTPFQPSPLTPSAYLPARLDINWRTKCAGLDIVHRPQFIAYWSKYLEGPFGHLKALVAIRATDDSDELINDIVFNPGLRRLKVEAKLEALERKYDLGQYLREYGLEEELPTWYLESYTRPEVIKRAARQVKDKLGLPPLKGAAP